MSVLGIEIIGFVSTLFILFSMMFKTTTIIGDIRMRVLNLIGSAIFIVYGCLLPAISTIILNAVLVVVNSYHLIGLLKSYKSEKQEKVK